MPNSWVDTQSFSKLRRLILQETGIEAIVNLGKGIFAGANVDTMLLLLQNTQNTQSEVQVVDASDYKLGSRRLVQPKRSFRVAQLDWRADPTARFDIHSAPAEKQVFAKMLRSGVVMNDFTDSSQGLIPYNTKEMSKKNPWLSLKKHGDEWKPLLDKGACIGRYEMKWNGVYVKFGPWLYTANKPRFYESPKILIQRHRNPSLRRRIIATFDSEYYYFKDNLCCLISRNSIYSLKFILGALNSTLLNEFYRRTFTEVSLNPTYLRQLPLPRLDLKHDSEQAKHDRLVQLVDQMLDAKQQLAAAQTERDKTFYENKCATLDRQIDNLVYELYDLTPDEIAIVESAASK